MEVLLPRVREPELLLPSYVKLDMAFGVGSGTTLFDKSRYRSHGAITTATWAAGLHGYCLDFNAANPDYVVIPATHTQLNFTSEDFSIIARVRVEALVGGITVFERGILATEGYLLHLSAPGEIAFFSSQALANQLTKSAPGDILLNTRYTIGLSRSGAVVATFKNGVDVTTVLGVHINPASSTATARIAIRNDLATQPLDGQIEFLRIFGGVALSTSAHLAWHNFLA